MKSLVRMVVRGPTAICTADLRHNHNQINYIIGVLL